MSDWKKVRLGDVCRIEKGVTGIASAIPGEYPLVVTAAERKTSDSYQFDCAAVCIPLVSSKGHGIKALNNVHYQEGKFALGTILCAVIPKNPEELSARYLHQYLQFNKDRVLVPLMKGAANVSLAVKDIASVEIPVPSIDNQKYFADLLNKVQLKGTKIQREFEKQKDILKKLRQSVLQDAIEGKLTEDWRKKHPVIKGDINYDAEALYNHIQQEKQKLIKSKELKKGAIPQNRVSNRESISKVSTWRWTNVEDVFFVTKLAGFEYTEYIRLTQDGEIPVIRAQNVRKGYIDKSSVLFIDEKTSKQLERSALTKECLLVTFIGAGIGDVGYFNENKRWHLAPNVAKVEPFRKCENYLNVRCVNFFMLSSFGQKEVFKHMKATAQPSLSMESIRDVDVPLPPLAEQKEIAARVESCLKKIDKLEKQIVTRETYAKTLLQTTLHSTFQGK